MEKTIQRFPLLKAVRLFSMEESIVFESLSYEFNINLGTWSHCRSSRYMVELSSRICGTKAICQCYSNGKEKVWFIDLNQAKSTVAFFVVPGCNEFITIFLTFDVKLKKKCFE